jgi:hypothetical protein
MTAPTRPRDGSCSRWVGDHYCGRKDGVRYYAEGHRCPAHTLAALRAQANQQKGRAA